MDTTRRGFLLSAAATGLGSATQLRMINRAEQKDGWTTGSSVPATYSISPVVSDGKYVLKDPPTDAYGYFYPREFEVKVGMSFTGNGDGSQLMGTTVAPAPFPEQKILDFEIQTEGCEAEVRALGPTAAQLTLSARQLRAGQTVFAIAKYRLQVSMAHQGFKKAKFPKKQERAKKLFEKRYFRSTPGIKCTGSAVKAIVRESSESIEHPWDLAQAFKKWVFANINGVPGIYTSVEKAIKNRKGDCEERAAVFIALCRSAGIPSRLVWVPGHNWAEIGLVDNDHIPHWIPVHTAAYSWFGWTGVHEIVMQKGDSIFVPHRRTTLRLLDDWYRLKGPRPNMVYSASVKPLPPSKGIDAGPGQREKRPNGIWELTGKHPNDRNARTK